MLPENREFYTIKELVESGYGSRSTIYRQAKSGELPTVKLASGRVIIPRREFERHLAMKRYDLVPRSESTTR